MILASLVQYSSCLNSGVSIWMKQEIKSILKNLPSQISEPAEF